MCVAETRTAVFSLCTLVFVMCNSVTDLLREKLQDSWLTLGVS